MIRLSILVAAVGLAACAPLPIDAQTSGQAEDAVGAEAFRRTPPVTAPRDVVSGGGSGGDRVPGSGGADSLPPGFDPTKPGLQKGCYANGTCWAIFVEVPR